MRLLARFLVAGSAVLTVIVPRSTAAQSVDRLLPDLAVASFSLAREPRYGTCNRLSISVYNGGRRAVSDVSLHVEIENELYMDRRVTKRDFTVGSLNPGETKRVAMGDVPMDSYRNNITARVDPAMQIGEASESNNELRQTYMTRDAYCNTFSVDDVRAVEGGTAVFTIRRNGPGPRERQTINWRTMPATMGGSATPGSSCPTRGGSTDYVAATGSVTFGRYDTSKTVSIQVCNDRVIEPEETIKLQLTNFAEFPIKITRSVGTATISR